MFVMFLQMCIVTNEIDDLFLPNRGRGGHSGSRDPLFTFGTPPMSGTSEDIHFQFGIKWTVPSY